MTNSSKKDEASATEAKDTRDALLSGSPEEKIQAWLTLSLNDDGHLKAGDWMESLVPHIHLQQTSPSPPHPSVIFTYTVQSHHCNRMNNLHGGCIASLFDFCTTLPLVLIGKPGFWEYMGVSRSLNVTYLRPAPVGEELLIECEIVQVGRTLATLKGVMRRKRDGLITAVCEHGKFNFDPNAKL